MSGGSRDDMGELAASRVRKSALVILVPLNFLGTFRYFHLADAVALRARLTSGCPDSRCHTQIAAGRDTNSAARQSVRLTFRDEDSRAGGEGGGWQKVRMNPMHRRVAGL